jgi:hypothetical protein
LEKNDVSKRALVVPPDEIFDHLDGVHKAEGHHKKGATWVALRGKFWNVTEPLVGAYIDLCPTCNQQQPVIRPLKGATKPIVSHEFRDRFQVDLIDMRTKKKENIYGLMMRWIMTVKDHSTGITHLSALPLKQPKSPGVLGNQVIKAPLRI